MFTQWWGRRFTRRLTPVKHVPIAQFDSMEARYCLNGGNLNVLDVWPGTDSSTAHGFTALGNRMVFAAQTPQTGLELWISDGTAGGTSLLMDLNPQTGSSDPSQFTRLGQTLFFTADIPGIGKELWKTDGTAVGTKLVFNGGGIGSSNPTNLTAVGSKLFYAAYNNPNNPNVASKENEIWCSDGTAAGTMIIKDIAPNGKSSSPMSLCDVNGICFFSADDGTSGRELWRSDGTADGTYRVADIHPGTAGSNPADLVNVNGTLFFSADDGASGTELWRSDGTEQGTVLVRDINPGSAASKPDGLFNFHGLLLFAASTATDGRDLWCSDGTVGGTKMLYNFAGGVSAATPSGFTEMNGRVYFAGNGGGIGIELFVTDGTANGAKLVKDIEPSGSSSPSKLLGLGSRIYFVANTGANGFELWQSDGTEAGTRLAAEVVPGTSSSGIGDVAGAGDKVFFSAFDPTLGNEPFVLVSDQIPPLALSGETTLDAGLGLKIVFSEAIDVATFSADDLDFQLVNGGSIQHPQSIVYDDASHSARLILPTGIADGDYRVTLYSGSVSDLAGNPLADDFSFDFFALGGDANRDRKVNFADLVVVAQNYGGANKSYAEGDFTGDGAVTFADLVVIAQRYGTELPATVAAPLFAAAGAPPDPSHQRKAVFCSSPVRKPLLKRRPSTAPG